MRAGKLQVTRSAVTSLVDSRSCNVTRVTKVKVESNSPVDLYTSDSKKYLIHQDHI